MKEVGRSLRLGPVQVHMYEEVDTGTGRMRTSNRHNVHTFVYGRHCEYTGGSVPEPKHVFTPRYSQNKTFEVCGHEGPSNIVTKKG
jgi:hypothetical protein